MAAPLELRQPRIAVYRRLGAAGPVDPTHRAHQGTQLYIAALFTIHGPSGVKLWIVIRDDRGVEISKRGPWPLSLGGSIDPMPAPKLSPGKYRVRLEGEMLPVDGPRRPLDEVAEWDLTITDAIEN